jgi:integrase
MARPRFLPKYVTRFTDRHGKTRYRYRRAGYAGGYFKASLGTEEFRAEYAEFEASAIEARPRTSRWERDSVGDVVSRYLSSPARLGPSKTTQAKVRRIVDKFREEHGKRMMADFRFEHIDKIIEAKRDKVQKGNRIEGGIEAARKLRKELVRLFDYAIKLRIRTDNPVRQAEKVRVPAGERSKGYHTWTEAEIAQYRAKHKLGTNARLAMELMLWTGQRRGDAIRLCPDDILAGRVGLVVNKTGKELILTLAPQLLTAIEAMTPVPNAKSFLINSYGRPYTNAGFGNKMREWCDEAGLPQCTAHGLRKAMMRRMADLNMANRTLKSVSGHTRDEEVSLYTEGANQARLADEAIALVSKWESNPRSLTNDNNRVTT